MLVKSSASSTTPTAEKRALRDDERARLALLAERLRKPEGLDHTTLERIEQLTEQ
jgi:hypothetical protein